MFCAATYDLQEINKKNYAFNISCKIQMTMCEYLSASLQ